jgi:hypothetical protein
LSLLASLPITVVMRSGRFILASAAVLVSVSFVVVASVLGGDASDLSASSNHIDALLTWLAVAGLVASFYLFRKSEALTYGALLVVILVDSIWLMLLLTTCWSACGP